MQSEVFLPLVADPPAQWPLEEADESAAMLTWRRPPDDAPAEATLEGTLLMALRFVAGAGCAAAQCNIGSVSHWRRLQLLASTGSLELWYSESEQLRF